ncbi:MAG: glycosyltransferase family 2 protein [Chloroflexi bacterium]|nr:glycosyltransferase family 2 protein [Chloroflexota bacterium]
MKLSVIICVYNERDTILSVIDRVQIVDLGVDWEKEIIVVDNCSTDGTRELLQGVTAPNVKIIYQPRNMGKGTSVRTAIPHCTGEYSITQDADLEYDPAEYRQLLAKALAEDLDVVYGSRVLGGKRYHHYTENYWAVRGLTWLTNLLFGSHLMPIKYTPRTFEQGKKIRAADGLRALWVIIRDRLWPSASVRPIRRQTSAG